MNHEPLNYRKELILPIEKLIENSMSKIQSLPLRKYKFYDLFFKKENGKIHKNSERIREIYSSGDDYSGLYILMKNEMVLYVGISRNVFQRLKDHFTVTKKNKANLLHLIKKIEFPSRTLEDIQNEMIAEWTICIIPESDSYILHTMEIFASCYYKSYWNTFRTH